MQRSGADTSQHQASPAPRSGWQGQLDRVIGSGATAAALILQLVPSTGAAIVLPLYAATLPINWSAWQLGLIAILGFDLVGGVLTNATTAAKRWYHRPGQGWQQHMAFVCVHLFHVGLVALLFRGGDGAFFVGVSSYLLLAAGVILASPLYLQRPFVPTLGLEWFLSLFFLKLLVSHLLDETTYSPS